MESSEGALLRRCVAPRRKNSDTPSLKGSLQSASSALGLVVEMLTVCAGCEDTPYVRGVSSRALIGACARVCNPGAKLDTMTVLVGGQGTLKSTLLRELAVNSDWFTDHISDISTKDAKLELSGRWLVEVSELSAVRKSETERVKTFLSTQVDSYRPPYAHRVTAVPRQCIFFGTSNDQQILTDASGARRFWCVSCQRIDIEAIRANRDQLWAEAYFRYKRGDPWWWETQQLDSLAAIEAEKFYEPGRYDEVILSWIEHPERREKRNSWDADLPWADSQPGRINALDCLLHGIGIELASVKPSDYHEVSRCLRHAGYSVKQQSTGIHRGKRYFVKGTL